MSSFEEENFLNVKLANKTNRYQSFTFITGFLQRKWDSTNKADNSVECSCEGKTCIEMAGSSHRYDYLQQLCSQQTHTIYFSVSIYKPLSFLWPSCMNPPNSQYGGLQSALNTICWCYLPQIPNLLLAHKRSRHSPSAVCNTSVC
jgi:hypothetical protein